MNLGLINLLLALGWCAVAGSFTLLDLAVGFALGCLILWLVRPLYGPTRYFERLVRLPGLVLFFFGELVVSSLRVAWDVITPRSRVEPGIVEVPLRSRTDGEIAAIANLVSLTPGTLTLAVRREPATIWVHGMYAPDAADFRTRLQEMEARTLHALRLEDGQEVGTP